MEGNEDPIYRNRRLARERKDRWKLCQSQETLIVYVLCKRRRYKSGLAVKPVGDAGLLNSMNNTQ